MKKNVIISLLIISSILGAVRSFADNSQQQTFVTATEANSKMTVPSEPQTQNQLPPGAKIVSVPSNAPADVIYNEGVTPNMHSQNMPGPEKAPTPPDTTNLSVPKIDVPSQNKTATEEKPN